MFRLIGEKIGRDAVNDLEKSGEMNWIIKDAVINAMEKTWADVPDHLPEKQRALRRAAALREQLGPRPNKESLNSNDWINLFSLITIVCGAISIFLLIATILKIG